MLPYMDPPRIGAERAVFAYFTTKPRFLIPAIMIRIESNIRSVHDRRRCHYFVCVGRPDISASGPSPLPPPAPWILRSARPILAGIFSGRGVRRFARIRPPEL